MTDKELERLTTKIWEQTDLEPDDIRTVIREILLSGYNIHPKGSFSIGGLT